MTFDKADDARYWNIAAVCWTRIADVILHQWISEVLHFCQGLPIILVGCKKDLRYDQKTIEELHKTSQKPVTPEQVRAQIDGRPKRLRKYSRITGSLFLQHQLTLTPRSTG